MATIAVDLDGTLVVGGPDGYMYPIKGAREALHELAARGHKILIYTCRVTLANERGRLNEELRYLRESLIALDIPFHDIHVGDKPVADAYVDDLAVSFTGDWGATMADLSQVLSNGRRSA